MKTNTNKQRKGLFSKCLLCLFMVLPGMGIGSPLLTLPHDAPVPTGTEGIVQTTTGIRIRVQGRALREVLQRIQNMSQVQFEVSSSFMEQRLSANLEAANWTNAIGLLLRDYNHIDVYKDAQHLQRVYLLKSVRAEDIPPIDMTHAKIIERRQPNAAVLGGYENRSSKLSSTVSDDYGSRVGGGSLVEKRASIERSQRMKSNDEVGPSSGIALSEDQGPPMSQASSGSDGPPQSQEDTLPASAGPPPGASLPEGDGPPIDAYEINQNDNPPEN